MHSRTALLLGSMLVFSAACTGGGGGGDDAALPGSGGQTGGGGTVGSGGAGSGGRGGSGGVLGSGGGGSGGLVGSGGSGSGGSGAGGRITCGGGTASAGDVTVNLSDVKQSISGFGASTAWGSTMTTSDADLLWSTTTGAGLSLHRVRINYTGTTPTPANPSTSELNIAKLAVARGAKVWATPWTPPLAYKTGTSNEVMGKLNFSKAQDYATWLKTFTSNMAAQGVSIYAISAQNEPDADVTYESCVYTGAEMATFVGQYLGPTMAGTGVKVMAPESQNWYGFPTFYNAMWADANAKKYTDIVATHEYGGTIKAYPDIQASGKEFWETEIYDTAAGDTLDAGMTSAMRIAKLIHDSLVTANMNAWHHWWVYSSGNGGLFSTAGNPTKRLWVEGNFARFVRPGYVRVGTSGSVSGVWVSAYKNPADGTVVVVAINSNQGSTGLPLYISGAAPCSMAPYVTSSSDSLGSKTAVTVASSRITYALPGNSVTTLVGKL